MDTCLLRDESTRALTLAHQLCHALGLYVHIDVSIRDAVGYAEFHQGCWVGDVNDGAKTSKAPDFGPRKWLEVYQQHCGVGQLLLTPVPGYVGGTGYMGGVRYNNGVLDVAVGVSKLAEEWDQLLALCVMYGTLEPGFALHHAGFRFPTEAAFLTELALYRGVIRLDASDHWRAYATMGLGYKELQWFPGDDGPHDRAMHLDVVTPHPVDFLSLVASTFGQSAKLTLWDPEPNSPVGAVWVNGTGQDVPLGLMARDTWWEVGKG